MGLYLGKANDVVPDTYAVIPGSSWCIQAFMLLVLMAPALTARIQKFSPASYRGGHQLFTLPSPYTAITSSPVSMELNHMKHCQ